MDILFSAVAIMLVLVSIKVYGEVLGSLWSAVGIIVGVIYLAFASVPLLGRTGPVTGWFRSLLSPLLPRIFTLYCGLLQEECETSNGVRLILVCVLSLVVPLMAAFYCHTELMLVLILINTALRIRKERIKVRETRFIAGTSEDGDTKGETVTIPGDGAVMNASYRFNRRVEG